MSFLVGLDLNDVQVQTDSGNASTTAFTLDVASTTNAVAAYISGVRQLAGTDYTVASTTITFTTAPPTGTNNIMYVYTKAAVVNEPADASVTAAKLGTGSVETAKLAADAVDGTKIADNAIDSEHYTDGSIDTVHIADDQITGAKLGVSLVQGDLLVATGTDTLNRLAKGSADQVLTMNDGATAAGWETAAGGGGAWNIIDTEEASGSANITLTGIDGTYDTYVVIGAHVIPATDASALWVRIGDSSGVDSGASDYAWIMAEDFVETGAKNNTTRTYDASNADTHIRMCENKIGTYGTNGAGFTCYLYSPRDAACNPTLSGWVTKGNTGTGYYGRSDFGGQREALITTDRIYFQMTAGNIEQGRFTLYGIAHA